MKAIRIHGYGGPEALVYEDAPQPEVKEGQVLVEVVAVSVNHIDVMMASGNMKDSEPLEFPWIPGVDFAGRIDYVGQGVDGFKAGDEVCGKLMQGSYAQYIAADAGTFYRMPANLSFAEAASVPHVGLTAWEAVFEHGRIEPGQNVLIHGASGAVGTFAVQIVKLAGGFVYAVDGGDKADFLHSLGADVTIDHMNADFTAIVKDIDLVLDFVGKDTPSRSYPVMKKGGRLVSTAAAIDGNESAKYRVKAVYMGVYPDFEDLAEITQLIEAGKVRTDIALTMPAEHVREAWEIYEKKKKPEKEFNHGKIVIEF